MLLISLHSHIYLPTHILNIAMQCMVNISLANSVSCKSYLKKLGKKKQQDKLKKS